MRGKTWSSAWPSAMLGMASAAALLAAMSCSGGSSPPPGKDGGPREAAAPEAAPPDAGLGDAQSVDASDATAATDASDAASEAGDAGGCPADGGIPDDLACTGLYSDFPSKTIASDVTPYQPALLFWSDGAVKSRWLYLPPNTQIDTTDPDEWVFPIGTKIWKQFVVGGQLIETRLLWKVDDFTWNFLVYLWSSDGTSATRFDNGETNVNGTTYEVPSISMCPQCHDGRNDEVLGIDLLGTGLAAAQGVTLQGLASSGKLTQAPPSTSVVMPEDTTNKAAAALGWLHVNCGIACHNSNINAGAQQTHLYMKIKAADVFPPDAGVPQIATTDTYTTAVNVTSNLTPNGMHYMRIAPGMSAESLIPLMDLTRAPDAGEFLPMPPLVSHVPDTAGVALVQAWIDAL